MYHLVAPGPVAVCTLCVTMAVGVLYGFQATEVSTLNVIHGLVGAVMLLLQGGKWKVPQNHVGFSGIGSLSQQVWRFRH